jgi:hypothetical protein
MLKLLRNLDVEQKQGEWDLAHFGGFHISGRVQKTWRQKEMEVSMLINRTGTESEIAFSVELTALGLVSRLEHVIDRFDADLVEERRTIVENTRRIADYQPRLGHGFTLAGELAGKLAELSELEASLAATAEQTEAEADDLDGVLPRLRGASIEVQEPDDEELEAA